jgi:hypothetical protein
MRFIVEIENQSVAWMATRTPIQRDSQDLAGPKDEYKFVI